MIDLNRAEWRKSTRSNDQGMCIEVADNLVSTDGVVGLRDSKDPSGPALSFSPAAWASFVSGTKATAFVA